MSPMPDPEVWPVCPNHNVAWVLRRCVSFNEGWVWMWQSDCPKKCRVEPALHNAGGLVPF